MSSRSGRCGSPVASSRFIPTAPALATSRAVRAASSGPSPYPASTSAVTGTLTPAAIRRTTPSISSREMRCPSGDPNVKAIPALVVAIAPNPDSSNTRALATSQAFGSRRICAPRCMTRNASAFAFCLSISMTNLRETPRTRQRHRLCGAGSETGLSKPKGPGQAEPSSAVPPLINHQTNAVKKRELLIPTPSMAQSYCDLFVLRPRITLPALSVPRSHPAPATKPSPHPLPRPVPSPPLQG